MLQRGRDSSCQPSDPRPLKGLSTGCWLGPDGLGQRHNLAPSRQPIVHTNKTRIHLTFSPSALPAQGLAPPSSQDLAPAPRAPTPLPPPQLPRPASAMLGSDPIPPSSVQNCHSLPILRPTCSLASSSSSRSKAAQSPSSPWGFGSAHRVCTAPAAALEHRCWPRYILPAPQGVQTPLLLELPLPTQTQWCFPRREPHGLLHGLERWPLPSTSSSVRVPCRMSAPRCRDHVSEKKEKVLP